MLKRKNRAILRKVLKKGFKRIIIFRRVLLDCGGSYSIFIAALMMCSLYMKLDCFCKLNKRA